MPRKVPRNEFWLAEQYENSVEIDGVFMLLWSAVSMGPQTESAEQLVVNGIEAFAVANMQVFNAYLRLSISFSQIFDRICTLITNIETTLYHSQWK